MTRDFATPPSVGRKTLDSADAAGQSWAMKSARVRAVLGLVSEFSDNERSELRAELDGALLSSPEEWNSTWNDELSSRIARIESGDVQLVDGADVLADLRGDLSV